MAVKTENKFIDSVAITVREALKNHPEVRKQSRFSDIPQNINPEILSDSLEEIFTGKDTAGESEHNRALSDLLVICDQMYKQNKSLRRNLKTADKRLAGYRELMRMISHDLKNSLTAIHGYNRLMLKKVSQEQIPSDEMVQNVERLVGNLYGLVDSLYGLSVSDDKKIKINQRLFDVIEHALQPVLAELELRLKEKDMGVALAKNINHISYYGDEVLFQSIFRNLLLNAVQYGAPHSRIDVEFVQTDERLAIRIRNEGLELEELDNDAIFEKYSRFHLTKEKTNIGIGLYVVKRIMQLYQGTIRMKTEANRFIIFDLSLPIKQKGI